MSLLPEYAGRVFYFGKLPSRGDFVKSRSGAALLDMLDVWIARGLELLSADPGWKLHYDAATPIDFAFLGTRSPFALAGRLAPSADASQRRFPFVAATALAASDPLASIARSPLWLAEPWQHLERLVGTALSAPDALPALDALAAVDIKVEAPSVAAKEEFDRFVRSATLDQVESALRDAEHRVSLRQSMLALGLLLQPVLSNVGARLDKALCLPLPRGAQGAAKLGAFWMDLVAPFLARGVFELGLFACRRSSRPGLIVSFNGASPVALQALLGDNPGSDFLIDVCDADWVEEYSGNDYGIKKLSTYLEMPQLSLRQAGDTFREIFLGA